MGVKVWSLGFGVWDLGFRVQVSGIGIRGIMFSDLIMEVGDKSRGFRVWVEVFGIQS